METIGYFIGQTAMWITIAVFTGTILWLVGGAIYFTYLDIKDIPRRRAVKASNARVDAIKAANRERVNAELDRLYPQRVAYRESVAAYNATRKWWQRKAA